MYAVWEGPALAPVGRDTPVVAFFKHSDLSRSSITSPHEDFRLSMQQIVDNLFH